MFIVMIYFIVGMTAFALLTIVGAKEMKKRFVLRKLNKKIMEV